MSQIVVTVEPRQHETAHIDAQAIGSGEATVRVTAVTEDSNIIRSFTTTVIGEDPPFTFHPPLMLK